MAYDSVTADPGSGGENFAFDQFLDSDGNQKTMAHGAISWGPINGLYQPVDKATPFPVDPDSAVSPQRSYAIHESLVSLGSIDLDSDQITTAKTGMLRHLTVWAARSYSATLKIVQNGVEEVVLVGGGKACEVWQPSLPGRQYIQSPHQDGVGFDGFRVTVVNLDPLDSTDQHVSFLYDEVAS